MSTKFKLTLDPDNQELISKGGDPLLILCREEVDRFQHYLLNYGKEFNDGLAKFEKMAIEGYLYQKLRGHFD